MVIPRYGQGEPLSRSVDAQISRVHRFSENSALLTILMQAYILSCSGMLVADL